MVWIPDSREVWKRAEIRRDYQKGDACIRLTLEDGSTMEYPAGPCLPFLCNPDILLGVNDLTALSYLHEPAVLHNLKVRFLDSSSIYTYCGIVLVAVNPYEQLPIYEEDIMFAYSGQDVREMDPHVFAVAEEAYKHLARDDKNQSLIISGESGAGKTVSAKYAMRYFATVGGSLGNTNIEEKVLASNPIMEAFGNAKTTRNDNSSRFGKYMEIGFDRKHRIIGASMKTYLLEKSRVTFQAKAERNYHIFYQLCASADLPEFLGLGLCRAEDFHYTNQGETPFMDSAADLEKTRRAFALLGIQGTEQRELFSTVAAILHLGNIKLRAKEQLEDSCFVKTDDKHLQLFCKLLGLEERQMAYWLCHRKLITVGETYVKPLSQQQAVNSCNALCKHMYEKLFNWIVTRINQALWTHSPQYGFIGVLDIYGFETFEVNSFEQFCINYANEKLQQQFSLCVFKLEQEEYMREEIPWMLIDFCDNQPCLDLIEAKLGILDLLDEECKMPKGSDQSWVQKLYDRHLRSSRHFKKPRMSNEAFIVCHFADAVEYCSLGFLEKNRDTIHLEPVSILRASKSKLVAELFRDESKDGTPSLAKTPLVPNMTVSSIRKSVPASSREHRKTIGCQFRTSLQKLMDTLNSTAPHYVRCIKPNDQKQPFMFDPCYVVHQLRACGVLESVRISATGYPSRWTYAEFIGRYRVVMREEDVASNDKNMCRLTLDHLLKDSDKYQLGNTKIFLRAGQVAYLEKLRAAKLHEACVLIQKTLRRWMVRRSYLRLRLAAIAIQKYTRGFLARRLARHLRQTRAAVVLQKQYRMRVLRRLFLLLRAAVLTIQAFARGMFARRLYHQMVEEQKAVVLQKSVRGWLARARYSRVRQAVIYLQCCYRRMQARRELRRLKIEARSVEHYKQLNRGMEIKLMQVQCKLSEQAKENKALDSRLSLLLAAHSEEVGKLQKEMQGLREDKTQQVLEAQQLLEKEQAEKESLRWKLALEISELKESFTELEKAKCLLHEEKNALNKQIAQHSSNLEERIGQRVLAETQHLSRELEEERYRYQNMVNEYSRLEQRHENLKDELTFMKAPGHRRSASFHSILSMDADSLSSAPLSEAQELQQNGPCGEHPNLRLQNKVAPRKEVADSTTPALSTDGGQAAHEGACNFLGQLGSAGELQERARWEMIQADREGGTELSGRREATPGLPKRCSKLTEMTEEDLKHAYDAVCVTNKLLEGQLQELRQRHKEELQELHWQVGSLKERQEILMRALQLPAQEQLPFVAQHQMAQLGKDNLELLEQLEKQTKNVRKLKKQLKLHMRRAYDAAANQVPSGPGQESKTRETARPTAEAFQGMLECRAQDEARLVKKLILDYRPQDAPRCPPELPAYILFMCFRHADHCSDEQRILSLFTAAVGGIKRVLEKCGADFGTVAFWLSNTCCLINCMKQYSGDEVSSMANSHEQNLQCLRNVDLSSYHQKLCDLAIQIYQKLIHAAEEKLKPMIVAGMFESDTIQGLSSVQGPGLHKRTEESASAYSLSSILLQLGAIHEMLECHQLQPDIVRQVFRQLFYFIGGVTLNYLLLRNGMCCWSTGVQIRYSVSQLEEWLWGRNLNQSGIVEHLETLIQAAQLLQVKKKTESDAEAICSLCSALSPLQIVKILNCYTPVNEFEERVTYGFKQNVQNRLQARRPKASRQLLVDLKHRFPLHIPFSGSPVPLDKIRIPQSLNLGFLNLV
ncbi:unconventional myosin-Va-like isoform X2 [Rhinatrema bivittatum]|nr:unconventional myosin-Va-like isoform X2 [Rhinatrema bivittatum]